MTRRLPALAAVLALTLPLALSACCVCPKTGKLMPCQRVSGSGGAASAAKAPKAAPQPQVVDGTRAAAVDGGPDMWVAAPGVHVSGQPKDEAWAAYGAAGYRTIVNFRPSAEGADLERMLVAANGMQYFHLPVVGAGITWGDADALAKILANPSNRPVLLHCSSGNRAAGVWALYQSRYKGLSKDAAIAAGLRVGPMKDATRKKLEEMLGGE